ncbi:hypothetical protein [Dongia sedimenti]|uniref:Negative modulator of initiation of replication SeqA N-terminal domain-containing protein n=1 Tax=Dongia sedimenti TaxID=3064282 RepID=A0ABU0YHU6_9PROT|nr:hypothetical protein [Rhodospirillaceae bacterium R-7]
MGTMQTIEIDFDVYKRIEMERRSFVEPQNAALRRLLKIDDDDEATGPSVGIGRSWSSKGVTLPHGTELRMEYNGRLYTGQIQDGTWAVEGKSFKSPSAAAGGVALTKGGKRTNLDGWIYWQVKRPGEKNWTLISQLRPQPSILRLEDL